MKTILKLFVAVCLMLPFLSEAQQYHHNYEPLPCLNKKFSIVAHIIRDSFYVEGITENAINSAVAGTSAKFDPICVDFEVCEFLTIDDFHFDTIFGPGEWEELNLRWHETGRINVYFSSIVGDPADPICGFAAGSVAGLYSGGIMLSKTCTGGLTHEMGHFFGLAHPFDGGGELVDGSNCATAGDGICDTPADPFDPNDTETVWTNQCQYFIATMQDANGDYYRPDIGNVMSYYGCGCGGFTYQQYLRMANSYLNAPEKMW